MVLWEEEEEKVAPFQLFHESLLNVCLFGDVLVVPSFVLRFGR